MAEEQFQRSVKFVAAFDKRHPDPHQNYGIHGVEIHFHLIGERGVTFVVIYTNWQLPEVTAEQDARPIDRRYPHLLCRPSGSYLGYHRPTPSYEGQDVTPGECEYLNGRPCYADGSFLMADDVLAALIREGDDGVWRELERVYRSWVLDEPEPVEATADS